MPAVGKRRRKLGRGKRLHGDNAEPCPDLPTESTTMTAQLRRFCCVFVSTGPLSSCCIPFALLSGSHTPRAHSSARDSDWPPQSFPSQPLPDAMSPRVDVTFAVLWIRLPQSSLLDARALDVLMLCCLSPTSFCTYHLLFHLEEFLQTIKEAKRHCPLSSDGLDILTAAASLSEGGGDFHLMKWPNLSF